MSTPLFILLAATIPLRNPFWPIGHQGVREVISDEARIQLKAAAETTDDRQTSVTAEAIAAAAEAADVTHATDRLWIAARKTLKIGGLLRFDQGKQSISINGKIYADGDLISVNVDGRRFTWRVKGLNGRDTLKLQRIRFRELEEAPEEKGTQK